VPAVSGTRGDTVWLDDITVNWGDNIIQSKEFNLHTKGLFGEVLQHGVFVLEVEYQIVRFRHH